MSINRVGERYITNEGLSLEIIEYINNTHCTVRFDNGYVEENRQYVDILKGQIKNPLYKSVYNIGYNGIGNYKTNTIEYDIWQAMMKRAYSKVLHKTHPSYIECTVVEEWHNFQNFAKWYKENYNSITMKSWHLDKDILVKGNKIYGPDTCCFVPQEINTIILSNKKIRGGLPIGVTKSKNRFVARLKKDKSKVYLGIFKTSEEAFIAYKIAKELHIKEVLEKWKYIISLKVYNTLMIYEITIND